MNVRVVIIWRFLLLFQRDNANPPYIIDQKIMEILVLKIKKFAKKKKCLNDSDKKKIKKKKLFMVESP
jgi:hypothetical protein